MMASSKKVKNHWPRLFLSFWRLPIALFFYNSTVAVVLLFVQFLSMRTDGIASSSHCYINKSKMTCSLLGDMRLMRIGWVRFHVMAVISQANLDGLSSSPERSLLANNSEILHNSLQLDRRSSRITILHLNSYHISTCIYHHINFICII